MIACAAARRRDVALGSENYFIDSSTTGSRPRDRDPAGTGPPIAAGHRERGAAHASTRLAPYFRTDWQVVYPYDHDAIIRISIHGGREDVFEGIALVFW